MTGRRGKPRNEAVNDLFCPPSMAVVIKSVRCRWTGDVARFGRITASPLIGKFEGKDHPLDLDVDGSIRVY